MIRLSPSILVFDKNTFVHQLTIAAEADLVAQIDIADGIFTNTATWPHTNQEEAKALITSPVELHLMVQNPLGTISAWEGVRHIERILVHHESGSAHDALEAIPDVIERYVVLRPETPIEVIDEYTDCVNGVMLMGVRPGAQGQPFIEATLDRIVAIKKRYPSLSVAIDGGVNKETIPKLVQAGADALCPGSAVFGQGNEMEHIKEIQTLLS